MTRKMVSRRLALAMAIMLLLSIVCQVGYAEASKTEAAYQKAIGSLSLYMRDVSTTEVDIEALYGEFDGMHHYRMSTEFSLYVQILQYIEENNLNDAMSWLSVLKCYPEFDEYLKKDEFSTIYPEIRSLSEMEAYINARREEKAQNYNAAAESYKLCLKFLDAMDRYKSLYVDLDGIVKQTLEMIRDGKYDEALKNAEYLVAANHESGQTLYDMIKSRMEETKPTPTPVILVVTPEPTKKPTTKKTTQPKAETKAPVTQPPVTQPPVTQPPVTQPPVTQPPVTQPPVTQPPEVWEWTAWSDWSDTKPAEKENREIQSTQEQYPIYDVQYKYSRWYYYNTAWEKWTHSYTQYTGSNYKSGSGTWQSKTTSEPLAKVTPIDGHQQYNGGWWNEQVEEVVTGYQTITFYRYRDKVRVQ